MKTIVGIDRHLSSPDPEGVSQEQADQLFPTFRKLFRAMILKTKPHSFDESDNIDQLRMKLMVDKQDIDLEDAEFNTLRSILQPNPLDWDQWMFNQLAKLIRDAENRKVEVKVKVKDK
jgi:hypothetical protein